MTVGEMSFQGPMILALLDGRKSQTRRLPGKKRHEIGRTVRVLESVGLNDDGRMIYVADGKLIDVSAAPDSLIVKQNVLPAFYMPRWAVRLRIVITDVREQRVQSISDEDAIAEGVVMESADPPFYYVPGVWPHSLTAVGIEEGGGRHAARSFGKLWDSIHDKKPGRGWKANPWVDVYTFRVERV